MENASKALIIAGAILLSILIIALGVFIYNQAQSAINTDSLSSTEVSAFNAQFDQYEGTSVVGSSVKALLSALNSNAATNAGAWEKVPEIVYQATSGSSNVTIGGGSNTQGSSSGSAISLSNYQNDIATARTAIISTHQYKVTMTSYNASGYVNVITIKY